MATNPYPYNQSLPWEPQPYESNYTATHTNQTAAAPQVPRSLSAGAGQKPKAAKSMAKARALGLVHRFKRGLVVASLAGFMTFGGLAAFHHVGTTTSGTTATASHTTSTSSSQKSSNNFLIWWNCEGHGG
jgi:hypothetical protein